jgi:hypothetical protein
VIKAAWTVNDRPVGSCSRHRSMANAASLVTRPSLPRSHLGYGTHVRLKPKARPNTFAHAILGEQGAEKRVSALRVYCTAMASSSWPCARLSHSCIASAPLSIPVFESIGSCDKLQCRPILTPLTARTRPRRPTQGLRCYDRRTVCCDQSYSPLPRGSYTPSSPHIDRLSAGRQ